MAGTGTRLVGAIVGALTLTGCGLVGAQHRDVSPTRPASTSATPTPTVLSAQVSTDGGPLSRTETSTAVARCLGKKLPPAALARVHVEFARSVAYLTDDVLTLPTVVLTNQRQRIVCNHDGQVPVRTGPDAQRVPDREHPVVVIADQGVTGTFNGAFADGMSPFAPCVVMRVAPSVTTVLMRLDWPSGDSVWYGAAVQDGYAVVSAWMGGTIGMAENIDLSSVRTQLRAYDAAGRELRIG